jgi:hypothetical protein
MSRPDEKQQPGLNLDLRDVKDGAQVPAVDVYYWNGVRRQAGRVTVYWPFVVFRTTEGLWNITHALTGYHVNTCRTKGVAVHLLKQLRAKADWQFTDPTGKQAARVKRAVAPLLPRLRAAG